MKRTVYLLLLVFLFTVSAQLSNFPYLVMYSLEKCVSLFNNW